MSVGGKKLSRGQKADEATITAMAHADVFMVSGRERKDVQKRYELAKCGLLEWLGDELSRVLPDGRTVFRSDVTFPEAHIDRKAYIATTVTVAAPPAAA